MPMQTRTDRLREIGTSLKLRSKKTKVLKRFNTASQEPVNKLKKEKLYRVLTVLHIIGNYCRQKKDNAARTRK